MSILYSRYCFFVLAVSLTAVHPVWAEDLEQKLESLLSFEVEREITVADINGCELKLNSQFKVPPAPNRKRQKQVTIDLERVGNVEQSSSRDRMNNEQFLIFLNPHGFGNFFKPTIPLNWVQVDELFNGQIIEETFDRRLGFFVPQEGRENLGRYLQKFISTYCGETF